MRTINLDATAKMLHENAVEKGFWETIQIPILFFI